MLEQFQPFPADAVFQIDKSRGVAARARQALDEAAADRIGDVYEHDWDRPSHLQQGFKGRGARSQDGVWCECHQFGHIFASVTGLAFGPASVDPNVAVDGPAQ